MLKALKVTRSVHDVRRALDLLDRSRVDICEDEVLLNIVLDTCMRYGHLMRLEQILDNNFSQSRTSGRPLSIHTYGSLIKSYGTLKRIPECWALWRELTQDRILLIHMQESMM